jgi:hypothetical protein
MLELMPQTLFGFKPTDESNTWECLLNPTALGLSHGTVFVDDEAPVFFAVDFQTDRGKQTAMPTFGGNQHMDWHRVFGSLGSRPKKHSYGSQALSQSGQRTSAHGSEGA